MLDADAALYEQMALGLVQLTGCEMEDAIEMVRWLTKYIVIPENPFTVH